MNGDKLFDLVELYAALGNHRAGTAIDHQTTAWMSAELERRGLRVGGQQVPFDHWSAASRLTADGKELLHLAVFHEWQGTIDSTNVQRIVFDPKSGGFSDILEEPIATARAAGAEALVAVTEHPEGSLVAINREPSLGSGFPVVLVAQRDDPGPAVAELRLTMEASTAPGFTTNLVARNDVAGRPLVLTTPMTGWFACAGERGTGIAVLLDLVEQLGDLPLLVVATGGHELQWFGATAWAAQNTEDLAGVVHVGASVGVVDQAAPGQPLASTRLAMTSLSAEAAKPASDALLEANLELFPYADRWIGEGQVFSQLDAPLLSVSGAGLDFHTPADLAHRATTPAAMATAARAMGRAARSFYEACSVRT